MSRSISRILPFVGGFALAALISGYAVAEGHGAAEHDSSGVLVPEDDEEHPSPVELPEDLDVPNVCGSFVGAKGISLDSTALEEVGLPTRVSDAVATDLGDVANVLCFGDSLTGEVALVLVAVSGTDLVLSDSSAFVSELIRQEIITSTSVTITGDSEYVGPSVSDLVKTRK